MLLNDFIIHIAYQEDPKEETLEVHNSKAACEKITTHY